MRRVGAGSIGFSSHKSRRQRERERESPVCDPLSNNPGACKIHQNSRRLETPSPNRSHMLKPEPKTLHRRRSLLFKGAPIPHGLSLRSFVVTRPDVLRPRRVTSGLDTKTNSNKLESLEPEDSETDMAHPNPNPTFLDYPYWHTNTTCSVLVKRRCDVVGCGHELGQRPHTEQGCIKNKYQLEGKTLRASVIFGSSFGLEGEVL